MRIAVLSGKGGTGKTFVSVNLAAVSGDSVYIDCDAEEPNGHLFFKPEQTVETKVTTLVPAFDPQKCDGCRKCVEFCHFNALAFIGGKPKLFADVCHACGGCALVCPTGAVTEAAREIGAVSRGVSHGIPVISGILNTGEASAVPVIHAALSEGTGPNAVIDSPPGSSCAVMEAVSDADYCLLVAEPTAFGFHNFQMVHRLVSLLQKPFGVVINKADGVYPPLEAYCSKHHIPILLRILYSETLAAIGARGDIAVYQSSEFAQIFKGLLGTIREEARP